MRALLESSNGGHKGAQARLFAFGGRTLVKGYNAPQNAYGAVKGGTPLLAS